MKIPDLVRSLPLNVRRPMSRVFAAIPQGVRYGSTFQEMRRRLRETETWTATALEEYQARELRRVVRHAYENVPFYRRQFERRGLRPTDIESAADLTKLPLLDKETIRANVSDLIARDVPPCRIYRDSTGATTGLPMFVYGEKGAGTAREWAFVWRGWNWAGCRYGERRAILRGQGLTRLGRATAPAWGLDPIHNAFTVSALDLTPENLPAIVKQMDELDVRCLQAYPSALYILTEWLRLHDQTIPSLKRGLTSSEMLFPRQQAQAESLLGIRIYDHYGNSERSALIVQCERQTHHIIPEYGIIELLDPDGGPSRGRGRPERSWPRDSRIG